MKTFKRAGMWRLEGHPRGGNHFITYPSHAKARQVAMALQDAWNRNELRGVARPDLVMKDEK